MHYAKLFIAGRPLLIILLLVEEGTSNEGVGYLIEGLHISGSWPILVYNAGYKIKELCKRK
jgi:hypothetical protein